MVTLQSKAWSDVLLTQNLAVEVMALFHKKSGDAPILLVEQLPEVIIRIKLAMEDAKKKEKKEELEKDDDTKERIDHDKADNLAQRLVPILRLLEASQKAQVVVTWDMFY